MYLGRDLQQLFQDLQYIAIHWTDASFDQSNCAWKQLHDWHIVNIVTYIISLAQFWQTHWCTSLSSTFLLSHTEHTCLLGLNYYAWPKRFLQAHALKLCQYSPWDQSWLRKDSDLKESRNNKSKLVGIQQNRYAVRHVGLFVAPPVMDGE
jgi:hypothetical protein